MTLKIQIVSLIFESHCEEETFRDFHVFIPLFFAGIVFKVEIYADFWKSLRQFLLPEDLDQRESEQEKEEILAKWLTLRLYFQKKHLSTFGLYDSICHDPNWNKPF